MNESFHVVLNYCHEMMKRKRKLLISPKFVPMNDFSGESANGRTSGASNRGLTDTGKECVNLPGLLAGPKSSVSEEKGSEHPSPAATAFDPPARRSCSF